ncbi:MAG: hypothetical protein AAFS07_08115 [Pseudomonadota bacterium]
MSEPATPPTTPPVALTKNTAVQLSIATLIGVAVAIGGGAFWASEKLAQLTDASERIEMLEDQVKALEAGRGGQVDSRDIAAMRDGLTRLEQAMTVTRCREEEIKDILDSLVTVVDQVSIIIQTGSADQVNTRARPQIGSLMRRLENWKCN